LCKPLLLRNIQGFILAQIHGKLAGLQFSS
jgi:hypothetical protein